ncbi:MAG: isoprenylcysteine carboxylmethyltransferase family protein [Polyangia bacterium]
MTHVLRCVVFAAAYLTVARLTAGRWLWLGGLLYTLFFAGGMAAQFILLALRNPTLLRERTATAGNTKRWDRLLMPITVVVLPLVALVVAGLDTRYGWTVPLPPIVQLIAAALGIGAYSLTLVSMMSNPFFSSVVRIQLDRGHEVHIRGPYAHVRHPGYVGMIGFFAAVPFLLGSWLSLIPVAAGVALHVLRTALEDRTLLAELPGYRDYAARVRYRLVPGIW